MKILIRNLARKTTEEQIRALFEPFGNIKACTLVLDYDTGKSKGFGFVEMQSADEAKAAIAKLNGTQFDGAKIRVKVTKR